MSKAQLDFTGSSHRLKPLWKETLRTRYPRHLLDSNFYPFFVYWASHIHLVDPVPLPLKGFQLSTALTPNVQCSVIYSRGCFPFAGSSYVAFCLVSLSLNTPFTPYHPTLSTITWKWFPNTTLSCPMVTCCQLSPPTYRTWTPSVCGPGFSAVEFSLAQLHLGVLFWVLRSWSFIPLHHSSLKKHLLVDRL